MDNSVEDVFAPFSPAEIADATTSSVQHEQNDVVITPVPDGAEDLADAATRLFRCAPDAVWPYKNLQGRLLSGVARWNQPNGDKVFLPLTYRRSAGSQEGWAFGHHPSPRPLYNLDQLAARPDAPIILCEGEKTANAAAQIFPDYVATTSPGGANAAKQADWSPLKGRKVLVLPDANDKPDKAGREPGNVYAEEVSAAALIHGAAEIHLIDTAALSRMLPDGGSREGPQGWDLADALEEGWELYNLRKAVEALTKAYALPPAEINTAIDTITSDPALAHALQELAALRPGDYQIRRKTEAKRLGMSVAALDSFVRQVRGDAGSDRDPISTRHSP